MAAIKLSQDDAQFLSDLQHELNTQGTDGNAQPVFWGVMEKKDHVVPDGFGDPLIHFDDGTWDLEEAIAVVEEHLKSEYGENDGGEEAEAWKEAWKEVDKSNIRDVYDYMDNVLGFDDIDIFAHVEEDELCRYTGAFLTKREAKRYVETYAYNHNQPRTYAMTAFRNFELERLLKILKTMEIKED